MTSQTPESQPEVMKLELQSAMGPIYRNVLKLPPRDARMDEIPNIDISGIGGSFEERDALAAKIKEACENNGFFYIHNHGISPDIIDDALTAAKTFFTQPEEQKELVSTKLGKYFNGYSSRSSSSVNPKEGTDSRETFLWRYNPEHDPDEKGLGAVPHEVNQWLQNEDFVWDGTSHLTGFKESCLQYWQECLKLSRRLVQIFALALDLPEDHFDHLVTYPGADGRLNHYRALGGEEANQTNDLGIGSHTDLQCFTLLWQDMIGGLQVLNKDGQWIKVSPIPGTLLVNIGDYLMRLTNDRFKSTVHRVFSNSTSERYSMPFFFGFNFNETCGVLEACVDDQHPAKYEPISCGEWCLRRYQQVMTG